MVELKTLPVTGNLSTTQQSSFLWGRARSSTHKITWVEGLSVQPVPCSQEFTKNSPAVMSLWIVSYAHVWLFISFLGLCLADAPGYLSVSCKLPSHLKILCTWTQKVRTHLPTKYISSYRCGHMTNPRHSSHWLESDYSPVVKAWSMLKSKWALFKTTLALFWFMSLSDSSVYYSPTVTYTVMRRVQTLLVLE